MPRKFRLDLLTLVAYLTLAGVTAYGLLDIDRIIMRWLALTLAGAFAALLSRYPTQDGTPSSPRTAALLVALQTGLVILLVQLTGSFAFLLLFLILSATVMLFAPLRTGLLWLAGFTLVTGAFLVLADGWGEGLRSLILYASGYLFLGIVLNALYQARLAQQQNVRLLLELQAKNRQLEEYAQQVETLAVVEERNRLAREMHDTLGHRLTTAAVQLEAIQRLAESDPARAGALAGTVRTQVRDALSELRGTVGRLREPVEIELSLPQALRRLAGSFQEATGLTVHLQIPEIECPMTPMQRLALFRTAQEGLTNLQRHAQAHNAWLSLTCLPEQISLQVEDDGLGMPAETHTPGFGLLGLQERASQLDGTLTLSARANGGTILTLSIPISRADNRP